MSELREYYPKTKIDYFRNFRNRMSPELFASVPPVQLSAPPILRELMSFISEAPIKWEKITKIMRMYETQKSMSSAECCRVGNFLEIHLGLVLDSYLSFHPTFFHHPIKENDQAQGYRYHVRSTALHGITTALYSQSSGGYSDFSEYDNLHIVMDETGKTLPVVWEAKTKLITPENKIRLKVDRMFVAESRKYWLHPLVERLKTTEMAVCIITTRDERIASNPSISNFQDEGGLVAQIPYTNAEFHQGLTEMGLLSGLR